MAVSTSQTPLLKQLDKPNAVLLGILAMTEPGKDVSVAAIVSLTYLLDDFSYQHDGVALTGFDYIRGDDGPSVVNDEVERRLDSLVRKALVHCDGESKTSVRSTGGYRIDERVNVASIPLSADDWALIHSVMREYGGMSLADIVSASKRTLPMKNGARNGRLQFQPNPEVEAFRQSVRDDPDFIEECMIALDEGIEGVDIEELRGAVVAEQTDA